MQINKLYETKLECSSYNVNIDSTDTTVTLTLVDFNGAPVTNTSVTLTADKGYFTKAVGKTTTNYTDASATKTINATTDNNGKVVATWTASEWGLCTFSANNSKIQISITGFREITPSGEQYCRVWLEGSSKRIRVTASRSITVSSGNANNFINFSTGALVNDSYLPPGPVYAQTNWNGVIVGLTPTGDTKGRLRVRADHQISTSSLTEAYFEWAY